MARSNKDVRPQARLPKGFLDTSAEDLRARDAMLGKIREVYERYGFEPLETPAIEYTEALGKFLPDQDRPNEGVFSFQDEDEQWLSLRYDLTAPLARYVAEGLKEQKLTLPFRRYAWGPVWRNEKPGPGRFRQFTQFDADTVGTDNIAADAELCMLAADTLEALGIPRGQYVIKVNNRKVLDGVLETIGLGGDAPAGRRQQILRSIDKYDRLGERGVRELLGNGRRDESGDFSQGVGLDSGQIDAIIQFLVFLSYLKVILVNQGVQGAGEFIFIKSGDIVMNYPEGRVITLLEYLDLRFGDGELASKGIDELRQISQLVSAAGYDDGRILIDPSVVRGLEYYTGPVFEAEITSPVVNEDGQTVRFGSVGGGGRYDNLIERFTGQKVPATGFSIGVSRLQAALAALGRTSPQAGTGPVVVLVMDKQRIADYQKLVQRLRKPEDGGEPVRAELYLGTAGMKAQMKYADRRNSPCVVIQGGDELAKGEVQIKDLIEGAKASASIKDSREWREARPAQFSVKESELLAKVREVLARHKG
jgi:histidyl-tRNA synthetase